MSSRYSSFARVVLLVWAFCAVTTGVFAWNQQCSTQQQCVQYGNQCTGYQKVCLQPIQQCKQYAQECVKQEQQCVQYQTVQKPVQVCAQYAQECVEYTSSCEQQQQQQQISAVAQQQQQQQQQQKQQVAPSEAVKMSGWDAYITTLIESNDGIKRGAIVGIADSSIWAKSQGGDSDFTATDVELKNLVNAFNDLTAVPTTGADLEGVHYVVPRAEDNIIFGKKGKQGFLAAKTTSAVLIAVFEGEAAVGSAARTAVEKLSSYLVDSGY